MIKLWNRFKNWYNTDAVKELGPTVRHVAAGMIIFTFLFAFLIIGPGFLLFALAGLIILTAFIWAVGE